MLKGLDSLNKDLQERAADNNSARLPLVLLKDGEAVKLRFLTDGQELITANFHPLEGRTAKGKSFYSQKYCGYDEGIDCEYCAQLDTPTPRRKIISSYVWVYEKRGADGTVEPVNAVKVLQTGMGKSNYIVGILTTFMRKYGTLVDRDYEWSRRGSKQDDTTYTLIPEDKGPLTSEQEMVKKSLPRLFDVVRGVAVVPGSEEKKPTLQTNVNTASSSTVAAHPSRPAPNLMQRLREQPKPTIGEDLAF